MLKYLASAFFVRPGIPGIGGIPVVVLATLGIIALTITKLPLMLVGFGAIAAFCFTLATTKRFRDLVDAQELAARSDLTDHGRTQAAKSRLLAQLRVDSRTRLSALESKSRRILELHRTSGADAFLMQNTRDALDKLQHIYLRLLVGEQMLMKAERQAEIQPLRNEIQLAEALLNEPGLSEAARQSRTATLALLHQRLEKVSARDGNLAEIQSDLKRVETQVDLVLDDAVLRGGTKPGDVGVNVDLASRMLDPSLLANFEEHARRTDEILGQPEASERERG
jgi:hypothetical protein